jgi:hypothetical protein
MTWWTLPVNKIILIDPKPRNQSTAWTSILRRIIFLFKYIKDVEYIHCNLCTRLFWCINHRSPNILNAFIYCS